MELLVSLCSVPVLRKLVCETVLRPPAPRLQPATRKGVQARGSEPSLALVHWVTSPLDDPEQCYMQALSLLTELFEVCLCFNSVHLNNKLGIHARCKYLVRVMLVTFCPINL